MSAPSLFAGVAAGFELLASPPAWGGPIMTARERVVELQLPMKK
jgi:hypothetical protein